MKSPIYKWIVNYYPDYPMYVLAHSPEDSKERIKLLLESEAKTPVLDDVLEYSKEYHQGVIRLPAIYFYLLHSHPDTYGMYA